MFVKKWAFLFLFAIGLFLAPSLTEAYSHSNFLKEYEKLTDEQKQQVDQVLNRLHEELENLGVKIHHPNPHHILSKLDEETKDQVQNIIKELEEGKITPEVADEKLEQIGVISKHENCKALKNLDDETKQKAKEILKEWKKGAITKEQAEEKFKELGIEMPKKPELDEATKEKAKQLIEEAEREFEKLGIEFPKDVYKHLME